VKTRNGNDDRAETAQKPGTGEYTIAGKHASSAFWRRLVTRGFSRIVIFLGVTGLLYLGLHQIPFLDTAERWVADFQIATLSPREPQHQDIVICAITEETLELFPYRSPVDRAFVAGLLQALEAKGARAVFVDLLFDQPTEPEKDLALKQVMDQLRVPLTVSYAREDAGLTERQVAFQDAFLRQEVRAFANTVKDTAGGTVRSIYPGRALPDGTFVPGVAGRIAGKLGYEAPREPVPLAYRGRPDDQTPTFKTYPAHALAFLPDDWIRDKIVLIGADLTLTDRHRTPFAVIDGGHAGYLPGVVIHGHAIAQLLEGRTAPEVGALGVLLSIAAMALAGMLIGSTSMHPAIRAVAVVTPVMAYWLGGMKLFEAGGPLLPLATPTLALIMAVGATDFITGRQERSQKRFISQAFSKYVSAELLDELISDPSKLSLEAERREVSLLFSDIAGFTTLSETLDAATLSALLNRYRQAVCRVIFRHGGTVNQFTGDGLYAMFSAPRVQPDHAARALACAVELEQMCLDFSVKEQEDGIPFGVTRVGVHTGLASVGNFGSLDRFEYTALGDAVNTASRVEGLNKYFETRVVVTGSTAKGNPDAYFRRMGEFVLKGKSAALEILQPLTKEEWEDSYMQRYRNAYDRLAGGDEQAPALFRALHEERPKDGCVAFHLARIEAGARGVIIKMEGK